MPKKSQRTKKEQQERNKLAHDLRSLRQYGDSWKELARTLLEEKKNPIGKNRDFPVNKNRVGSRGINRDNRVEKRKKIMDCIKKGDENGIKDAFETRIVNHSLDIEVAESLIKWWYKELVAENMVKFERSDYYKIFEMLIESGYSSRDIAKIFGRADDQGKPKKIDWLDQKTLEMLIEKGWGPYIKRDHLRSFEWLDKEMFLKIFEDRMRWKHNVVRNLGSFNWLDKGVLSLILEDNSKNIGYVAENLGSFEWLDEDFAKELIEKWYWDAVVKHPEAFGLKKEK